MIIVVKNHPYRYDMESIATLFFPFEKIKVQFDEENLNDNIIAVTEMNENKISVTAKVYDISKSASKETKVFDDVQVEISVLFYNLLSSILNVTEPWGILYGVRPARLMHSLVDESSIEEARDKFINSFLVSKEKTDLAIEVMKNENKIIALSSENSFSLYVSIPFCPSRCAYCSFVSHSIESAKKLMKPYVDLLLKELEETAKYAKKLSLRLESIYFGGGTPTTLEAEDFKRIFKTIEDNFDLSTLREYTVEAGRPDTITKEKLLALKEAGVSRISINPQTFNDEVLTAIGRRHTVKDTIDAFNLARKVGFDNINMDFIAGLQKDTLDSFKNSIDTALKLGAESITVHTLARKSGAYLATKETTFNTADKDETEKMVRYSNEKLSSFKYKPYYMYRQSKSVGNLENVGWAKEGKDCLYNVFMMDETHSVFSVGAGAVTKLKNNKTGKISRIYNYKYPYEYINNFDEVIKRKEGITDFYAE